MIAKLLREGWLAPPCEGEHQLVFCNRDGRAPTRHVGDSFRAARERSGITASGESRSILSAVATPRC